MKTRYTALNHFSCSSLSTRHVWLEHILFQWVVQPPTGWFIRDASVTCKRAVDHWQVELLPKAMKELLTLRGKSDGFEIFEYVIMARFILCIYIYRYIMWVKPLQYSFDCRNCRSIPTVWSFAGFSSNKQHRQHKGCLIMIHVWSTLGLCSKYDFKTTCFGVPGACKYFASVADMKKKCQVKDTSYFGRRLVFQCFSAFGFVPGRTFVLGNYIYDPRWMTLIA